MDNPTLLTKSEAADLLGISVSTFDRVRKRKGLLPAGSARLIPVRFDRAAVLALGNNSPRVLTVDEIRTAADQRSKSGRRR